MLYKNVHIVMGFEIQVKPSIYFLVVTVFSVRF